jgi:hypothetical protein
MKRSELTWKDYLAVILGLSALAGLVVMFNAEANVQLHNATTPTAILQQFNAHVLPGIKKYSLAFGAILLVVGISLVLLGGQEDISTSLDEPGLKK